MASEVLKQLHETEQRLWNEVQNMHKTLVEESRDFNADETIKFENLHAEIDSVDKRKRSLMEDEKRAYAAEQSYNEFAGRQVNPEVRSGDDAFMAEVRSFSKGLRNGGQNHLEINTLGGRAVNRLVEGGLGMGGVTPEEMRAVTNPYNAGGTPTGSFTNQSNAGIVPIDFYDRLVSYLVEVSGVMQTGPTVHNTQGGEPIQIPVVTLHTGYTTANVPNSNIQVTGGQGATLQQSDPTFSQDTLSAQKFGDLIQVSREILDDSGINLLQYLASSAGRAVGNSLGQALVQGGNNITSALLPSVSKLVTGATTAGNTATGQVAGGPSYTNLIDMQYSVIAPYRQSKSTCWLAADQTLGALRKLTDLNGRPLWEPSVVLGAPDLMLGKPLVADPFMPALNTNPSGSASASILFGDFSQFVIRLVGGVRFERSDDFAFNQDLVTFRTVLRADATYPLRKATNAPQAIVGFVS